MTLYDDLIDVQSIRIMNCVTFILHNFISDEFILIPLKYIECGRLGQSFPFWDPFLRKFSLSSQAHSLRETLLDDDFRHKTACSWSGHIGTVRRAYLLE